MHVFLGQMFVAALIPVIVLVSIYILYLLVRSWLQPHVAPALSGDGYTSPSMADVVKAVLPPIFLIVAVLGSILIDDGGYCHDICVHPDGLNVFVGIHRPWRRRTDRVDYRVNARRSNRGASFLHATALKNELYRVTGVDQARIVTANGSEELLSLLCRACLNPGERVVTCSYSSSFVSTARDKPT